MCVLLHMNAITMKIGVLLKKKKNKNNNKKMEIVHMTRHQNSFSELQSIVHEKMDT